MIALALAIVTVSAVALIASVLMTRASSLPAVSTAAIGALFVLGVFVLLAVAFAFLQWIAFGRT